MWLVAPHTRAAGATGTDAIKVLAPVTFHPTFLVFRQTTIVMDQKKARNAAFRPERTPLQDHEALRLVNDKVTGPFSFLNPTRAVFNHHERKSSDGEEIPEHEQAVDSVNFRWTSRNNRKGRHQLDVSAALDPATAKYLVPEATNSPREILKNIGRMFTKFPFYDVSYDVAFVFTIGSVVWVINSL